MGAYTHQQNAFSKQRTNYDRGETLTGGETVVVGVPVAAARMLRDATRKKNDAKRRWNILLESFQSIVGCRLFGGTEQQTWG